MADQRLRNFAKVLVDFSVHIEEGDRVLIEGTYLAQELAQEVYIRVLERGGHPYFYLTPLEMTEIKLRNGSDAQILHTDQLRAYAYEHFESRIHIRSEGNTQSTAGVDVGQQSLLAKSQAPISNLQFSREGKGTFKRVTTLVPTRAYAQQAGMGLKEYEDFFFAIVRADDEDPVAYWENVKARQQVYVDALKGHDKVEVRGPNVDLSLSIKGRTFINSFGLGNMPSGEIFTGPVEDSVNGWVRFTYPAQTRGNVVEGAELTFKDGKVVEAKAEKNEEFLKQMIKTDQGASYLGEFAIGLNDDIDRFTGIILLDEKIGGTFHMALGKGYPETGSQNDSAIHWDLICDMRKDAEILVDGELFYKNGKIVI